MKRLILLVLLTLPIYANATRARLFTFGQDTNGSLYIDDARNIFKNPALINQQGEQATFEFGSATSTPNAEGGFIGNAGPGKVAVQLGRQSEFNTRVSEMNATPYGKALIAPANSLNIIYGMGAWGVGVYYANSKDEATPPATDPSRSAQAVSVRGGVAIDKFDAFAGIDLAGSSKTETAGVASELKSSGNVYLGGRFKISADQSLYAEVDLTKYEVASDTSGADVDRDKTELMAGYYQQRKLSTSGKAFFSAGIYNRDGRFKLGDNPKINDNITALPISIGVEGEMTSWLEVRGAVTQRIIIDSRDTDAGKDDNYPNTTFAAAGLSLKNSNFKFDGVVSGSFTSSIVGLDSLLYLGSLSYNF